MGKRGRPRAYDPETALRRATEAFWDAGFAATSLEDLGAATGMNRPSLYAAFGDKRALYRQALARYRVLVQETLRSTLDSEAVLRLAIGNAYRAALDIFCAGAQGPHGCFMIGTVLTEAVLDEELRAALIADLLDWDQIFAARFSFAKARGELGAKTDPASLARFAAATLHSLAIRARAGETRTELENMADATVALICDAGKEIKPTTLFGGTY
jgi:AcrR family transcriptional regulator